MTRKRGLLLAGAALVALLLLVLWCGRPRRIAAPRAVLAPCDASLPLRWDFTPTPTEPLTTHFELERKTATSTWEAIGSTEAFNEKAGKRLQEWFPLRGSKTTLQGTAYDYRVRAVSGSLRSGWSNVYTCPPAQPVKCYAGGQEIACSAMPG
jgi:hypothetical protein